jgi:hypothetical protein
VSKNSTKENKHKERYRIKHKQGKKTSKWATPDALGHFKPRQSAKSHLKKGSNKRILS